MNIGSKSGYPSSALSNFAPHPFVFDGVECSSLEGLLQSLKFDKPHVQVEVCKLVGLEAKYRGKKRNKAWKRQQTLWWKGVPMNRHSDFYQEFLDKVYEAVYTQNEGFRRALIATGNSTLTHSIGHNDASETVLTEREFCSRLEKLRRLT
jgi:predicted NAD-dependent protein-ADP-ribosyltransferase YbiA (DUF1768 family)